MSVAAKPASKASITSNSIRVKAFKPERRDKREAFCVFIPSKSHNPIEPLARSGSQIGEVCLPVGDGHYASDVLPIAVAKRVLELHVIGLTGPRRPDERRAIARRGAGDNRGIQKCQ